MKKLLSVMLIDDDEISNSLNQMTLEELEIANEIKVFCDAEVAIECLKEKSGILSNFPELIIVDLNMPGISGEDFILHFNALPLINKSNFRIIIYSALLPGKQYEYLKNLGVDDFIEKPLTPLKINQLLERLGISVM